MEEAFYSGKKDPSSEKESANSEAVPADVAAVASDGNAANDNETDTALLMKLLQKPEMAALLKTLAASL